MQEAGLLGRDWVFDRRGFDGKTPSKHATAPADLEPPERVGVTVRVTSGVGLVWADVNG